MEFLFDVKWNDACPFLKRVVESYLFERERSSFYNTLDSLYGCGKCKRHNHHQCLIYLKTKFPHLYKTYHLTICPQHRYHYYIPRNNCSHKSQPFHLTRQVHSKSSFKC